MSRVGKPSYSVVITTYRRPRAVVAAVQSVLDQELAPQFELIVVDNDPDGSALKGLRAIARDTKTPVRIVHERRIGLASARNAGVAAAQGSYIAFLDDNQVVSSRWLHHLARVQSETGADLVFGAIHARLSEASRRHNRFYETFFTRDPDHHEGPIDSIYDCRCALVRAALLPDRSPFELDGHDARDAVEPFLANQKSQGCTIAWAASAWVWQMPGADQLSMRYSLRSAYNLSRETTMRALAGGSRGVARGLAAFSAGLTQAVAFAPVALAMFCTRSRRRAFAYRRFVEGVGRMLWAPAFRLRGPDLELIPVAG